MDYRGTGYLAPAQTCQSRDRRVTAGRRGGADALRPRRALRWPPCRIEGRGSRAVRSCCWWPWRPGACSRSPAAHPRRGAACPLHRRRRPDRRRRRPRCRPAPVPGLDAGCERPWRPDLGPVQLRLRRPRLPAADVRAQRRALPARRLHAARLSAVEAGCDRRPVRRPPSPGRGACSATAWSAARGGRRALALPLHPAGGAFQLDRSSAAARFASSCTCSAASCSAAGKLWGYVASALGLALVPAAVLASNGRSIPDAGPSPAPASPTPRAALARRPPARPLPGSGRRRCWHPGCTPGRGSRCIVIFVGLAVWSRLRHAAALARARDRRRAAPRLLLPALPRYSAWHLAAHYEVIPRLSALALLAGFGPARAGRALGVRRPEGA